MKKTKTGPLSVKQFVMDWLVVKLVEFVDVDHYSMEK